MADVLLLATVGAIRRRAVTVADRRTAADRTEVAVAEDMEGNTTLDSFPA
ncbi:MAG: hypothetical protein ABSA27_09780 [Terriglobales bacterium]